MLQVNNEGEGASFKPNLNKKTVELIERKYEGTNVYQRLTQSVDKNGVMPIDSDNQYTFVPHINPISDELDNRMKMGVQGFSIEESSLGGKERWQTLYELGLKKKEDREI